MKKMIAAALAVFCLFTMVSCNMGLPMPGTARNANTADRQNTGSVPGQSRDDIYGKYKYGSDVYEYRNDGYVYKNDDKAYRYSILDGGKLRLYRALDESSGYDDYDYTYKDGSLVYGGRTYSRLDPTQN